MNYTSRNISRLYRNVKILVYVTKLGNEFKSENGWTHKNEPRTKEIQITNCLHSNSQGAELWRQDAKGGIEGTLVKGLEIELVLYGRKHLSGNMAQHV